MMESDWLKRMVDDVSNHSLSTMILFVLVAVVTFGYILRMLIPLIFAIIDTFKELSTLKKTASIQAFDQKRNEKTERNDY